MRLTDIAVKNAKPSDKPTKISDGKGLYLLVHPNGSKYWQAAYRYDGKQKSSQLAPTLLFRSQKLVQAS
jgi:hypothetical protein